MAQSRGPTVLSVVVVLTIALSRVSACRGNGSTTDVAVAASARSAARDWWQVAQFYQIYPRSFMDSNGDGIGDLAGITSKLSYLKEIGITATWLSPIYTSPMADFGYDIADFFDIQAEYGTLSDFDALIAEAKRVGVKVIMDFVPNHSSDENEWFKKSVRREPGYEDYYVWHDGKLLPNGTRVPPTNWLQAFRGSAWEWNDARQQYYLHQFAVQQPDLNYRNPAVVAQMKRVLTYWLDRGVAGFRIDAVPWCFEVKPDVSGQYPDEPLSGHTDDVDNEAYLSHIYTQDQPETLELVYQWHDLMEDYQRIHGGDTRILMIESWSPLAYTMKFYGDGGRQGAQIPFNFQFISGGNGDDNTALTAGGFVKIIRTWLNNMPAGKTANWVMGNHDRHRVGTRYGEERIDLMNMLQMFLPGVSVTYQGDEIGMVDLDISWADSRDPAACNANANTYASFSRDPERTPFQWSSAANAGFSSSSNTWLPINPNYVTVNVDTERRATQSHFNIYKQMSELRQTDTLKYGDVTYGSVGQNILAIKRSLSKEKTYLLLANVLKSEISGINVSSILKTSGTFTTKIVNINSNRQTGASVDISNFQLRPNEAIIVESA